MKNKRLRKILFKLDIFWYKTMGNVILLTEKLPISIYKREIILIKLWDYVDNRWEISCSYDY